MLRRRSDENAKPVFLMPPVSQAVSSSSGVRPQACQVCQACPDMHSGGYRQAFRDQER